LSGEVSSNDEYSWFLRASTLVAFHALQLPYPVIRFRPDFSKLYVFSRYVHGPAPVFRRFYGLRVKVIPGFGIELLYSTVKILEFECFIVVVAGDDFKGVTTGIAIPVTNPRARLKCHNGFTSMNKLLILGSLVAFSVVLRVGFPDDLFSFIGV
jgi:hypothetical protein